MVKEEVEEKEKEEEKEREVVELSDSKNGFDIFNQPLSLETTLGDLDHSSTA